MKIDMRKLTVQQVVDDFRAGHIWANPEYQRGEVWNLNQQKRLIDSLLRGYQLPTFYLHQIKKGNALGEQWSVHEIIDGQQRCKALDRFIHGNMPLYEVGDPESKFPVFLRDTEKFPCPWGGKRFSTLSEEWQSEFLNKELQVAFIVDADENVVRDLFIRLQSGSALNEQEKRDAYPGQFTEFILNLGGKPALQLDGYSFFTKVLKMKPGTDRGKTRQLAAQITVLYLERLKYGNNHISDGNRAKIWEYYDTQLNFHSSSSECRRLLDIIEKLGSLLSSWTGPKLAAHNAIALVLFLDSIWEDYTSAWGGSFVDALKQFEKLLADGNEANKTGQYHPAWQAYGQYARANADSAESIRRRQDYFSGRMVEFLGESLIPKDTTRLFNDFERRYIYWRDDETCQVCNFNADWQVTQAHHVIPHASGGRTVVENGALVHAGCHPQSASDIQRFADKWFSDRPKWREKAGG